MADQEVKAIFSADTSGITSGARTAAAAVEGYQKSVSSAMNAVGKGMVVAGAAITAVGVTSVKSFGSFQSSLNQAAVIAGGTSKDIQGLADVANKMGADLPISAGDAAKAMVAMARDGATIKTIKAEFPAIAQAATAAGADLQRTASVVQQSMNIWGKSIQSPQRAAAVLTQTANLSNASIEDMQQALATIGGTANNAGIDMQTTSTAIGLLTNRGFSAAQASQDLNHALLLMQAPSKKGAEMMKNLGVSMTDTQGNMKPLPQILNEIGDATAGMTSSDKAAALKTMFGSAGMAAILPLMDSVKDKTGNATTSWEAFTKEMDNASSSTKTATKFLQQQADEMQKNLGSKIEQVGGNWEALSNKAMAGSAGITGNFLDMTNSALSWAGQSDSAFAQFGRQIFGLAPIIGPATTALGGFITNAGKIGGLVKGIGTSITGAGKGILNFVSRLFGMAAGNTAVATSSAGASAGTKAVGKSAAASAKSMLAMGLAVLEIGLGIGLATAGIALLVFSIKELAKSGSSGADALFSVVMAIAAVVGIFAVLGKALTAGAVGIVAFGVAILAIGVGVGVAAAGIALLVKVLGSADTSFSQIVKTMTAVGVGFAMMITGFVTTLAAQMPIITANLLNMLLQFLSQLATYTPQIISRFLSIFTGFIDTITIYAPGIALSITNMLVAMMTAIATNTPTLVSAFTNMVVSFLNSVVSNIPAMGLAVTNLLVAMMTSVATNAPQLIASFTNMVVTIIGELTNSLPQFIAAGASFLISLLEGIAQQMPGIISSGVDVIVSFIEGIGNNLGRIISAGIDLLGKFMSGIADAIPQLADTALQAVMKFVYGVGYALGRVLSSGGELLSQFVQGIIDGFGKAQSSGSDAANSVLTGVKGISLEGAGRAIMDGFLGGLKKAWEGVKSFVNGIAGWVKDHKGPISYDKKLLIPAGQAIMGGFNSSLQSSFEDVKNTVNGVAPYIASAISGQGDYMINTRLSDNMKLDNGSLSVDMNNNSQPANINLVMGGSDWTAHVDDISNTQGNSARLSRNNSVYL